MGAFEIILIIACALIVGGVIVSTIIRKKKGKTGCGGSCSGCSGCPYGDTQNDNKQ